MTGPDTPGPGRLVFGGSFNPPHVGHVRLAVEAREILGPLVDRVDLVPCACPPHKDNSGLLPFSLRVAMLEAAIAPLPQLHCNRLEGERHGPSYTCDTLVCYKKTLTGHQLYFLLGSQDYALLPTWRRGLELPRLCQLVVVPRGGDGLDAFLATSSTLWPGCHPCSSLIATAQAVRLPDGGMCHFLPLPWLDVSASRIRRAWLAGRDIRYLTPDAVLDMLSAQDEEIRTYWRNDIHHA